MPNQVQFEVTIKGTPDAEGNYSFDYKGNNLEIPFPVFRFPADSIEEGLKRINPEQISTLTVDNRMDELYGKD